MRWYGFSLRIVATLIGLTLVAACANYTAVAIQPASVSTPTAVPPTATNTETATEPAATDEPTTAPESTATLTHVPPPVASSTTPHIITISKTTLIDVSSGETRVTIQAGQEATIPLGNQSLYILVHFPDVISPSQRPLLSTQISSPNWQVEIRNAPSADTYAFALLGKTLEFVNVQINRADGSPPIKFSLNVTAPVIQTLSPDESSTINLKVGEEFALKLGAGYNWQYSVSDTSVLAPVSNVPLPPGTVAIFQAKKPGTARIFAVGQPLCQRSHLSCGLPSLALDLIIVVQ